MDELRFAPPIAPNANRSNIHNGDKDVKCPQASPAWLNTAINFIEGASFANATPINYSETAVPPLITGTTEDCLFLDVRVSQDIFHSRGTGQGAPVLVWIHGGGYLQGYKSQQGSGRGLILANEDVVFVAFNYRLGLFVSIRCRLECLFSSNYSNQGWLSGPSFESHSLPNLGLRDQRLALDWIQKYIHLFGGDPSRVTIMAESAGAGSLVAHLTSYSGDTSDSLPFSKAIVQSPWILPFPDSAQQESLYQSVIDTANVTSFESLRGLSSNALMEANNFVGTRANYGTFVWGPVVDGKYIPATPARLLASGRYHQSVQLMTGHNLNEGILFTSPFINNTATFEDFVSSLFPATSSSLANGIAAKLYQSSSFTERTSAFYADVVVRCNTLYLLGAYSHGAYAYRFGIPPGWHSNDEPYTFYEGDSNLAARLNGTVAETMQGYFTQFASLGNPNKNGLPHFAAYSNFTREIQELDEMYIGPRPGDISASVCKDWLEVWQ